MWEKIKKEWHRAWCREPLMLTISWQVTRVTYWEWPEPDSVPVIHLNTIDGTLPVPRRLPCLPNR